MYFIDDEIDKSVEPLRESDLSKYIVKPLKWGDAIQVGDDYRNNSKYYWDNGWHEMNCDKEGIAYSDYGLLPTKFAVLYPDHIGNKPIDYFSDTISYSGEYFPFQFEWYSEQLLNNASVDLEKFKVATFFVFGTKKYNIVSPLLTLFYDEICSDFEPSAFTTDVGGGPGKSKQFFTC